MKQLVIVLWLLACVPALPAQEAVSRERLRADLDQLTSERLAGRVSLGAGATLAAEFIAASMREMGLESPAGVDAPYLQGFDVVPIRLDRDRSGIAVERDATWQTFNIGSVFLPDPARAVDLT